MYADDLSILRAPIDGAPLVLGEVWETDPRTGEVLLARLHAGPATYLVYEGIAILSPREPAVARFSHLVLTHCARHGAGGLTPLLRRIDPRLALLRRRDPAWTLDDLAAVWLPLPLGVVRGTALRALRGLAREGYQHAARWPRLDARWRRLAPWARQLWSLAHLGTRRLEMPPSHRGYATWRTSLSSYYAALPLLPQLRGARILDLGSGLGHLTYLVGLQQPRARCVRVDRSLLSLLAGRRFLGAQPPDLDVVCDAGTGLPLADASVDSVFSCDALHFLNRQERGVEEIRRVLAPAGQVVLSCLRDVGSPRAREIGTEFFRSLAGYRALLAPLATDASAWWEDDALAACCLTGSSVSPLGPAGAARPSAYSFVRCGKDLVPRWVPPSPERGSWRVNPVYRIARAEETLTLERRPADEVQVPDVELGALPARWTLSQQEGEAGLAEAARRQVVQFTSPLVSPPERYWRRADPAPAEDKVPSL